MNKTSNNIAEKDISNLENINLEEQMKYFYNLCKTMDPSNFTDLVSQDVLIEEKEFYMTIWKHFMHKEQRKIINQPFKL